jgi:small subunit ribosomal protein S1
VGQVRTGRVTRLAEFGAFVELEPGVEALAHASTFAPTGHSKGWFPSAPVGLTAAFEILSIDLEKKRIGVALVEEGSARAAGAAPLQSDLEPGEHTDVASPEGFGSLADKLRGALKPREK